MFWLCQGGQQILIGKWCFQSSHWPPRGHCYIFKCQSEQLSSAYHEGQCGGGGEIPLHCHFCWLLGRASGIFKAGMTWEGILPRITRTLWFLWKFLSSQESQCTTEPCCIMVWIKPDLFMWRIMKVFHVCFLSHRK